MKAKFLDEDPTSVFEEAATAVATSASGSEEGSGPEWHPQEGFDPKVVLEGLNSRNTLSGSGSDDLRFSHTYSQSIIGR